MAKAEFILKIDAALAERLRMRAQASSQSVEDHALGILQRAVAEPGFEESEMPWGGSPVSAVDDRGFDEDSEAYADYIDRICDEAERTGGVPFEVFQARLRSLGQSR